MVGVSDGDARQQLSSQQWTRDAGCSLHFVRLSTGALET